MVWSQAMPDPDNGVFSVLPALHAMGDTYRFCTRCWMPLAPVRRCLCAHEPYPEDATPARVIAEHPQLRQMAAAVASGRYADDTATREARYLEFLKWLYDHRCIGEHAIWTYELMDADANNVG